MNEHPIELHEHKSARQCPYCHDGLAGERDLWTCDRCDTVYHGECARENGRCAVMGCGAVAVAPPPPPATAPHREPASTVPRLSALHAPRGGAIRPQAPAAEQGSALTSSESFREALREVSQGLLVVVGGMTPFVALFYRLGTHLTPGQRVSLDRNFPVVLAGAILVLAIPLAVLLLVVADKVLVKGPRGAGKAAFKLVLQGLPLALLLGTMFAQNAGLLLPFLIVSAIVLGLLAWPRRSREWRI